jgi:hypothetical protein
VQRTAELSYANPSFGARRPRASLVCGTVLIGAFAATSVFAQSLFKWEEYGASVTSAQKVSALSDDAFGDNISLFNGSTSFTVTDISLPGNAALPVAFGRTFSISSTNQGRTNEIRGLGGLFD